MNECHQRMLKMIEKSNGIRGRTLFWLPFAPVCSVLSYDDAAAASTFSTVFLLYFWLNCLCVVMSYHCCCYYSISLLLNFFIRTITASLCKECTLKEERSWPRNINLAKLIFYKYVIYYNRTIFILSGDRNLKQIYQDINANYQWWLTPY